MSQVMQELWSACDSGVHSQEKTCVCASNSRTVYFDRGNATSVVTDPTIDAGAGLWCI